MISAQGDSVAYVDYDNLGPVSCITLSPIEDLFRFSKENFSVEAHFQKSWAPWKEFLIEFFLAIFCENS